MRKPHEIIPEMGLLQKQLDQLGTELLFAAGWTQADRNEWGRIRGCWQKTVNGNRVLMPKSQALNLVINESGAWADA